MSFWWHVLQLKQNKNDAISHNIMDPIFYGANITSYIKLSFDRTSKFRPVLRMPLQPLGKSANSKIDQRYPAKNNLTRLYIREAYLQINNNYRVKVRKGLFVIQSSCAGFIDWHHFSSSKNILQSSVSAYTFWTHTNDQKVRESARKLINAAIWRNDYAYGMNTDAL